MNGSNPVPEKAKKPLYKKWWFWVLALVVLIIIIIIIIAASAGDGKDDTIGTTNTPLADTGETETAPAEKAPAATPVRLELSNGHYTAGIDFPAGRYDIEAVSGSGNVSSSNMYSGGINAIMGTKEENEAIGSDIYEQKYANINLPDGVVLSISGVTVRITSEAADGAPLKTRRQPNTETVELGSGNFVAGTDFSAGTYDIIAVSGGGNVSSDNMYDGGINAIMGTADKNKEIGSNLYQQEYKNIELPKGTTLTVSGVGIKLVPSK
jgi:hypothetical protein